MPTCASPPSRWSSDSLVLTLLTTLALAACQPSSEPSGDVTPGTADDAAATVAAADGRSFEPADLRLEAGREVTLEITNTDDLRHDFAIPSLELNTGTIEAGESATATFTVPAGTTEFVCTFHPDMTGRITSG